MTESIKILIEGKEGVHSLIDNCCVTGDECGRWEKVASTLKYPLVVYWENNGFSYANKENITGDEIDLDLFIMVYSMSPSTRKASVAELNLNNNKGE